MIPHASRDRRVPGGTFAVAALAMMMGATALLGPAAGSARGASIFDDDWVPPHRADPTPTTSLTTRPARPSPNPIAPKPQVTRPAGSSGAPADTTPPAASRRPIPPAADRGRSSKLMKEAFAKDLINTAPTARRALAKKLLDDAAKMDDAPADQFVVLGGAIQAAVEAADLPLALDAADRMAAFFELDAVALKAAAALKIPPKGYASGADDNVPAALALLDPLESAEDLPDASRLLSTLQQSADEPSVRATLSHRAKEIEELRAARERLKPALEKLRASPEDPAANLAVGRYTAMLRGDWEHGLPLLARGDDPRLAALAKAALADPADASARAKVADGWWELAQSSTGRAKVVLLTRAAEDYRLAVPGLAALTRIVAEKRAAEAEAAVAATGRGTATVHLFPLISDKDLADAGWTRQGPAAVSNGKGDSALTLPYRPPDEYDLTAEFSRLKGSDAAEIAFPVGKGTCDFVVGAHGNLYAWLGKIAGKWEYGNPTRVDAGVPNDERHRMLVTVRHDRVEGYLDGKRLCSWKTNGDDLAGVPNHTPRAPGQLTVGSWISEVAFYSVDVTPVRGVGRIVRE